MVRILIGTLLQIANGRRPVHDLARIIAAKDRQQAGPTASPSGLYLLKVTYKSQAEIQQILKESEQWRRENNGD